MCDVLYDLVPFVQFTKRENIHGGVLLLVKLQACNFTAKGNTLSWVFFRFLSCANGTKSRNASQYNWLKKNEWIQFFRSYLRGY